MPSLVVTLFGMLLELHKKEEALKSSSDEQVRNYTELLGLETEATKKIITVF